MSARYYWVITKDHIGDPERPAGTSGNAVGLWGPRGGEPRLTRLANPARFSIYDDDGVCYYEGMIYGDYTGFEPLDDFGMPNAGATAIKISGEWL